MGLVTLAALVANEAMTRGVLTFSGTSFVAGGASLGSRWSSIGLAPQTAIRYGPPVGLALAAHREILAVKHPMVVSGLPVEAVKGDEMRRLISHQLAPLVVACLALMIAGPVYGGEVVGGVYGVAAAAGLLTHLTIRQLKLPRG